MTDYLRPRQAAERFQVSRRTLGRWADDRLIGRVRIDGVTLYRTSDIADLLTAHTAARRVVPYVAPTPAVAEDQYVTDFWAGTDNPPPRATATSGRRGGGVS